MNEQDYLRDVLTVARDIRGMTEQAVTEPADVGMWLELIRNAADQLVAGAQDRLRDTERAELHAMTHD